MKNHRTIEYPFYKELGKVLSKLRIEKGYSLEKVAKEINVSKSTVDKWELGKTRIGEQSYRKICKLYGVNPDSEIIVHVNFWRTEL